MLIAARSSMMKSAAQNPYVTNGLVAMWDGIYNMGLGKAHDSSSPIWFDCINRYPILCVGASSYFSSNSINNAKQTLVGYLDEAELTQHKWMFCEIVVAVNAITGTSQLIVFKDRCIWISPSTLSIGINKTAMNSWTFPDFNFMDNQPFSVSVAYNGMSFNDYNGNRIWLNGQENGTQNGVSDSWNNILIKSNMLGASLYNGNSGYLCNATYYAIRLYNRVLTQDEINANYETDKQRFELL